MSWGCISPRVHGRFYLDEAARRLGEKKNGAPVSDDVYSKSINRSERICTYYLKVDVCQLASSGGKWQLLHLGTYAALSHGSRSHTFRPPWNHLTPPSLALPSVAAASTGQPSKKYCLAVFGSRTYKPPCTSHSIQVPPFRSTLGTSPLAVPVTASLRSRASTYSSSLVTSSNNYRSCWCAHHRRHRLRWCFLLKQADYLRLFTCYIVLIEPRHIISLLPTYLPACLPRFFFLFVLKKKRALL